MARIWMVRGDGGNLYDVFRDKGIAAIGWAPLAALAQQGANRQALIAHYEKEEPQTKRGRIVSGASQVWRFVNDIKIGDGIVSYSPANRLYLIGKVTGAAEYHPEYDDEGMSLTRTVDWQPDPLQRDSLSTNTKNSLGSISTVFEISTTAREELNAVIGGRKLPTLIKEAAAEEEASDPWGDIEDQAIERIKDGISGLSWEDMQELIAGILRAMGYKTQVSKPGADRGKDIVASPDGFGFEHPRIVVEVKHRKDQMGAPDIRSFLGGRHKDDRGLYVSTGGFTKDAWYEADRAAIPLAMWTLDNVVRALVEHYDQTDTATKRLVPLKRLYWPA